MVETGWNDDPQTIRVFDSQFGYGRLQPLFEIPDAENITIHGCDSVKVHYADGTVERWPPVADSDDELLEQLLQMGSNARPRRTLDAPNGDMTLMARPPASGSLSRR